MTFPRAKDDGGIFLVREVIATWSIHRNGRVPNADEAVAAVVYYADHDAYLLPFE